MERRYLPELAFPFKRFSTIWKAGETIDSFLEGFPTVTREQVIAFLEEAKARMVATDA